ncbi:hypothetical protein [Laspinema olomoucense]|uniref:Uncharacterized protein n=1 Tax=Laspinema olomoucense D3b TaxID=2953688 RepID=A0ABT2N620_9CYAN|nr:hypothetical protein [Laspinema sp. D3b]MCT7978139.1 hypothetical protein [Laspinema sp. D3b]
MFPLIAYAYQTIAWVKGDFGDRTLRAWVRLRWPSYREGINAWIICLFSVIIAFFSALAISLAVGGTMMLIVGDGSVESAGAIGRTTGRVLASLLNSPLAVLEIFTLFILLYRYEEWAQQWKRSRKIKKLPRSANPANLPKIKPAPVNPVDLELDKMRADYGLIKMKSRTAKKRRSI